jgi:Suppressor of fused protein (SUFU)
MVPLYSEERDLELDEGLEALFERFVEHKVSLVLDPGRVNAAFSDDEEQG